MHARQLPDPEAEVDASHQTTACLDADALQQLVTLGLACERLFGPRQDIEWALAGGNLYLLQCRPVTKRTPASHRRNRIPLTITGQLDAFEIAPAGFEAATAGLCL